MSGLTPDARGGAAFVETMRGSSEVGVEDVFVMPLAADPIEFIPGLW